MFWMLFVLVLVVLLPSAVDKQRQPLTDEITLSSGEHLHHTHAGEKWATTIVEPHVLKYSPVKGQHFTEKLKYGFFSFHALSIWKFSSNLQGPVRRSEPVLPTHTETEVDVDCCAVCHFQLFYMATTCSCSVALGFHSAKTMAMTSMCATSSTSDGTCSTAEGRSPTRSTGRCACLFHGPEMFCASLFTSPSDYCLRPCACIFFFSRRWSS